MTPALVLLALALVGVGVMVWERRRAVSRRRRLTGFTATPRPKECRHDDPAGFEQFNTYRRPGFRPVGVFRCRTCGEPAVPKGTPERIKRELRGEVGRG